VHDGFVVLDNGKCDSIRSETWTGHFGFSVWFGILLFCVLAGMPAPVRAIGAPTTEAAAGPCKVPFDADFPVMWFTCTFYSLQSLKRGIVLVLELVTETLFSPFNLHVLLEPGI